uniref:Uncharacterized protein n=1 Tax=Anolis carolinensis TaxID=28377 RepID=A0A803TF31_ANOCA
MIPGAMLSIPCGLPSDNPCVTQGPGSKVIIHPPEIEICLPGPIVEIMAAECAVEVYNPCEAITGEEQCAITSGDEDTGESKALATREQLVRLIQECRKFFLI